MTFTHYAPPIGDLPRVSHILEVSQGQQEKQSLDYWRDYVGNEEANRIVERAIRRGDCLHEYMQALADNEEQSQIDAGILLERLYPTLKLQAASFYYGTIKQKILSESLVYSQIGYAGTADFYGCILQKGHPTLAVVDYKSKGPKPPMSTPASFTYSKKNRMQIAAYCVALREMGYECDAAILVYFCEGKEEAYTVSIDIEKYYQEFLERLRTYQEIISQTKEKQTGNQQDEYDYINISYF